MTAPPPVGRANTLLETALLGLLDIAVAHTKAAEAERDRLRARVGPMPEVPEQWRGEPWWEGYAVGCEAAHSHGCEAVMAERDRLREQVQAVRALHRPFRIYDECGHEHTDEDVDQGRAVSIDEVGYTCADGYLYTICRWCCTDGSEYQTETCATNHAAERENCCPCPTARALGVES